MAERVDMEFRGKATPRKRYPWDKWADGSKWLIKRGEDYLVSDGAMRGAVYAHASVHGLRARTQITDEGMLIQLIRPIPVKKVRPRKLKK